MPKINLKSVSQAVSDKLKSARCLAGYKSAKAFALNNDIPYITYSQHESGKRKLSAEVVLKYAKLLDVDVNWLLDQEISSSTASNKQLSPQEFKKYINQNKTDLAYTKIDSTSSTVAHEIDIELMQQIAYSVEESFNKEKLDILFNELLLMSSEIYNEVITGNLDYETRTILINTAVKSYKHGLRKQKIG